MSEDESSVNSGTSETSEVRNETSEMRNEADAQNTKSMASFKLILLVLMVLQNSSTVLVGRHTRSSVAESELYVVNHLILITEFAKV